MHYIRKCLLDKESISGAHNGRFSLINWTRSHSDSEKEV